jgi:hypothetical protein
MTKWYDGAGFDSWLTHDENAERPEPPVCRWCRQDQSINDEGNAYCPDCQPEKDNETRRQQN